jgi:hypothetical protein
MISLWAVVDDTIESDFNNTDPDAPSTTYAILNTSVDIQTVQPMYDTKPGLASPLHIFNMNFASEADANNAVGYLLATWPLAEIEVQGAWYIDTGIQMGQLGVYDVDGVLTAITGIPTYPIPIDAYELMPPIIVYDEFGDEVSNTPATSNADLRDINKVLGQADRRFTTTL